MESLTCTVKVLHGSILFCETVKKLVLRNFRNFNFCESRLTCYKYTKMSMLRYLDYVVRPANLALLQSELLFQLLKFVSFTLDIVQFQLSQLHIVAMNNYHNLLPPPSLPPLLPSLPPSLPPSLQGWVHDGSRRQWVSVCHQLQRDSPTGSVCQHVPV